MNLRKKPWLISRAQIAAGDIDTAILHFDPEQLSENEVFGLHGSVRLRVEGANGPADIFLDSPTREYFRKLHQRWPWAGYFLRLAPIANDSPATPIIDLGTFMGIALCHVDELIFCTTPNGTALRYNGDQLCRILAEFQGRAAELSTAIGLPEAAIRQRDDLITESVLSFFAAGQSLQQQKKNRKKGQ